MSPYLSSFKAHESFPESKHSSCVPTYDFLFLVSQAIHDDTSSIEVEETETVTVGQLRAHVTRQILRTPQPLESLASPPARPASGAFSSLLSLPQIRRCSLYPAQTIQCCLCMPHRLLGKTWHTLCVCVCH
jgi:hypothetical protein